MNCFSHALPFLDNAYFMAGSCLPDWLSACDRKCRVREKAAMQFVDDDDPIFANLAGGIVQHHRDDHWFHKTPIFNELILNFAVELRELFNQERSMRPSLIGHILVEMFLDAFLHKTHPGKLDFYYQQIATVDANLVQSHINRFATRPTDKLSFAIRKFMEIKFLYDYETDEGTLYRINKVMWRVKLESVPDAILKWMPSARRRVYDRAPDLLSDYSMAIQPA